jgi:chromosome segregation ATPase
LFSSNVRLTVALTRLSLQSLQPGLQALPEEVEAAHSQSDNVRNAVEEMAETVSQLEENLEEAMIDVGLTEVHALSLALSARQLSQTRRRTKRVFRPRITKTEGAGAD